MDEFEYENHVWCERERTQHYGNLYNSKGSNTWRISIRKLKNLDERFDPLLLFSLLLSS